MSRARRRRCLEAPLSTATASMAAPAAYPGLAVTFASGPFTESSPMRICPAVACRDRACVAETFSRDDEIADLQVDLDADGHGVPVPCSHAAPSNVPSTGGGNRSGAPVPGKCVCAAAYVDGGAFGDEVAADRARSLRLPVDAGGDGERNARRGRRATSGPIDNRCGPAATVVRTSSPLPPRTCA